MKSIFKSHHKYDNTKKNNREFNRDDRGDRWSNNLNEKCKSVARKSEMNYNDAFSTTNDAHSIYALNSESFSNSNKTTKKPRFNSNNSKYSNHKKLQSTESNFEARLEYYSNFLEEFREQRMKESKPISNNNLSKIISRRGLFSASPPKIMHNYPQIKTYEMKENFIKSKQGKPIAVSHNSNLLKSYNPSPARNKLKTKIEITETFTTPTNTLALNSKDLYNPEEVVSYEISSEELFVDTKFKDHEVLGKRVIDKNPWKQSEDQKLIHYYTKYPDNWVKISSFIENHDENECRNRFNYLQQNKIGAWSDEEMKKLLNLYTKYGKNWKVISNQFKDRTPTQIKDKIRSLNKLKDNTPNLFQNILNNLLRNATNITIKDDRTPKQDDLSKFKGTGTLDSPISIKDIIKIKNLQRNDSISFAADESKDMEIDSDIDKDIHLPASPLLDKKESYKKYLEMIRSDSINERKPFGYFH